MERFRTHWTVRLIFGAILVVLSLAVFGVSQLFDLPRVVPAITIGGLWLSFLLEDYF